MLQTTISRRVHFSSGHRYAVANWSMEKNMETYGSLFSQAGFGHNFILEATVTGPVSDEHGMIINMSELDSKLQKVVEPLDHHFLNTDVDEFKSRVPTLENIARYCFKNLKQEFDEPIQLDSIRLYEDSETWVDIKP